MQQQQQQPQNPFLPLVVGDNSHNTPLPSSAKIENGGGGGDPQQIHNPFARRGGTLDMDAIKAKIISHPQYSSLLEAYMDCQKVGAPPEVVARLTGIARDFSNRQRAAALGGRDVSTSDPELDQFMEAYYDMLVKYREELTRPLQEAMDFLRRVELQFNALTNGSARVFAPEDAWMEAERSIGF